MASSTPNALDECRRRPLQAYNSFPRADPALSASELGNRATTIDSPRPAPSTKPQLKAIDTENMKPSPTTSVFGSTIDGASNTLAEGGHAEPKTPADFDELPLEIISLCDTFIDSLSAKVHPSPPSVDRLSSLFQDFYVLADTHINTHISMLSTRQHKLSSASSSSTSLSSRYSKARVSRGSKDRPKGPERRDTDQRLLTPEEVAERKRARKQLEKKRIALEEAVERRVTEKIYDRIWRHRSTQDEAQDEKLRSKTAALAVVGIGLTDLGIDLGQGTDTEKTSDKESEVKKWLEGSREELRQMNQEKSPLGKLQKLKAAHKCIVETLSHFHPSSSADEIMPMLIYTLITSPAEGIDVISNLYYIQRFRSESKIDGEAAYCLTNLEAAITFLETVDLSSLRADESVSGPAKTSPPTTPTPDSPASAAMTTFPVVTAATPAQGISAPTVSPALIIPPTDSKPLGAESSLRPNPTNRRLSELSSTVTAGKEAVFNTADQSLKTIGSSLGQSYDFLIGKLKERQESLHDVLLPKTLDDARKLVGTESDDGLSSKASSIHASDKASGTDKLVSMISGRPARDRSADSALSGASSGKKVAFFGESNDTKGRERPLASPLSTAPVTQVAEGIRMLSSSFNPMSKFAQMRAGFSRSAPQPAQHPALVKEAATKAVAGDEGDDGEVAELTTAFPDLATALPPKEVKKIDPPIQRFMDVRSPGDLKLNEVVDLLKDYRRLANALRDMGAV